MGIVRNLLVLLGVLAASAPVFAGDIHGRIQLTGQVDRAADDSLDAAVGEQNRRDLYAGIRLTWEPRRDNWDATVHYQLTADAGDDVSWRRKTAALFGDAPPVTLFDLTSTLRDDEDVLITHRVDRLAIGYSTPGFVLRVGRQALTWGTGRIFHVMDLVGPFSPKTVDTEYKPGVDMVYLQWLFDDGSDLQCVAAPRAEQYGGEIERDASTVALYFRHAFGDLGTRWLLAHDYENWSAGLGVSGPLAGASWNVDIVPTFDVAGETRVSALANIDYSMILFNRNSALFFEYYRNGFGVGDRNPVYDTLPDYLTERLVRGQVFNLSRNYLAGGLRLEWTPLFSLSPSVVANLDDHSLYTAAGAEWSLGDNTTLLAGAEVPLGSRGTEYGGVSLYGKTAPYVAPTTTVYVQVRDYF